jgi:NAD(P)-dependent dehydrogenase (short-subunit alcohol dehydrogenase family)
MPGGCTENLRLEKQVSRAFITGSTDGPGLMAAQLLVELGHNVVLHARQGMARSPGLTGRRPDVEAAISGVGLYPVELCLRKRAAS